MAKGLSGSLRNLGEDHEVSSSASRVARGDPLNSFLEDTNLPLISADVLSAIVSTSILDLIPAWVRLGLMHEEAMIDAQEKSKDVNEMNASSKKSLLKRVKALSQSLSVCLIL